MGVKHPAMGVKHPARMVTAVLAVALAGSIASAEPARVQRVGLLLSTSPAAAAHIAAAFDDAMTERGWVLGKNLVIERRWAGGQASLFAGQAAELVQRRVDVIVASSQPAAVAARRATTTIPIVMVNAADPVGAGLVASLAQPGGNVTGIAAQLTPELRAKQLQLIRDALPGISRVAVLRRKATVDAPEWADYPPVAQALGLKLQFRDVEGAVDLAPALAAIARERPVVLLVPGGDPVFFTLREQIVGLAREHGLPGSTPFASSPRPEASCRTRRPAPTSSVGPRPTWTGSSGAGGRRTCPSSLPPTSSWSSICAPRRRSASPCPRPC